METGTTTLAFTPAKQREAQLIGGVSSSDEGHHNVEICLDFPDVERAYKVHLKAVFCDLHTSVFTIFCHNIIR